MQNKVFILTDQHGGNSEIIIHIHIQLRNVMVSAAKQGRCPKYKLIYYCTFKVVFALAIIEAFFGKELSVPRNNPV